MHFLPQKMSGNNVREEHRELEYYPPEYQKNSVRVENFYESSENSENLARNRPERPPLPARKEDYSEYFQYFTVKEKTPSVPEDLSDERIVSSSLVRETSSIRRRKKKVKRRRSKHNPEDNNEDDAEYYQPFEPEETSSRDEFDYGDVLKVTDKYSNDSEDEYEDEPEIELHIESDYSQTGGLNDFHPCKDQFSDEYASVPLENCPTHQPRKTFTDSFSEIFQKSRSLRNLRTNISNLGIYAQPKARVFHRNKFLASS